MSTNFKKLALTSGVSMALAASPLQAEHFKKLSVHHTSYGVAQLNYGNIPGGDFGDITPLVKLMNPVHVEQVAAAIVYEAERGPNAGRPEVFAGCNVKVLAPHASRQISETEIGVPDSRGKVPKFAEIVWAPMEKVRVGKKKKSRLTRLADGLGGNFDSGVGNREGNSRLAHPGLFSLPSVAVVPGQRQAAIDCVCDELDDQGLPGDVFSVFGFVDDSSGFCFGDEGGEGGEGGKG